MPRKSSRKSSFNELCRQIVTSVDVASRKILQELNDDEPNLDRLRRGDFAKEASEIEPFLDDARTRLAEYDHGINQLEDAFNRLKAARSAFKHSIDVASNLTAPVHSLPEDVLVEIFSIYIAISVPKKVLAENPLRGYFAMSFAFYDGGLFCPTLQLSHVCTFWREVTFSRPALWASLSLELHDITRSKHDSNLLSLLSHYLSHSYQHPLNVNVSFKNGGRPIHIQAFEMLIDHCAQWQRLNLRVHLEMQDLFLSRLRSADQSVILPLLKVLCLPEGHHNGGHPHILAHVPNLEHLHGGGYVSSPGFFWECAKFSWEEFRKGDFTKLKGIHDVSLSGASIGQFLAQTPVLEECELNSTSGLLSADLQDPYHVSSLKTLSIHLGSCPPEAWRTLRTPNLTSLALSSSHNSDEIKNNIEEISAMLLQSGCMLQRISLKSELDAYAIGLLRSHPSVENLVVGSYTTNDYDISDLFAGLTISEGDVHLAPNLRYLAPNLRYLEIDFVTVNPRVTDHICDMVRSRAGIVDNRHLLPLQEMVLAVIQPTHQETEKVCQDLRSRLAPFTASGLRLSISMREIIRAM